MFISKEEVEKKLKELAEELNQYELPFDIYEFLKYVIEKYGKENYWKYLEKSPLPFSDYVKASYDFRRLQANLQKMTG